MMSLRFQAPWPEGTPPTTLLALDAFLAHYDVQTHSPVIVGMKAVLCAFRDSLPHSDDVYHYTDIYSLLSSYSTKTLVERNVVALVSYAPPLERIEHWFCHLASGGWIQCSTETLWCIAAHGRLDLFRALLPHSATKRARDWAALLHKCASRAPNMEALRALLTVRYDTLRRPWWEMTFRMPVRRGLVRTITSNPLEAEQYDDWYQSNVCCPLRGFVTIHEKSAAATMTANMFMLCESSDTKFHVIEYNVCAPLVDVCLRYPAAEPIVASFLTDADITLAREEQVERDNAEKKVAYAFSYDDASLRRALPSYYASPARATT
jgi:hypothetical protein